MLDVQTLVEGSEPRPRISWIRFGVIGFIVAAFISWYMGHDARNAAARDALDTLLGVGMFGLVTSMTVAGMANVRRARADQAQIRAIEELVQLRRWPEAAMWVQSFLSRPARSAMLRAQAILYLALVLARYHRFEEAVSVYDYILDEIPLDDSTQHSVRLGRAMALLREENLLDADRAISDLRRTSRGVASAGLSLVEIYRDVKTGHPAEAIEMFESQIEIMRKQLGHRMADAWGLIARAYDLLGRLEDAKKAYCNATILAPLGELQRRYPEISALADRYVPSPAPPEVM